MAALTLPGFVHDVCATAMPLAIAGAAFRGLPLHDYGVEFVQPELPVAHPFDDGEAVAVSRSVDATARGLGRDEAAWRKLYGPLDRSFEQIIDGALGPLRVPRHPLAMARFGWGDPVREGPGRGAICDGARKSGVCGPRSAFDAAAGDEGFSGSRARAGDAGAASGLALRAGREPGTRGRAGGPP